MSFHFGFKLKKKLVKYNSYNKQSEKKCLGKTVYCHKLMFFIRTSHLFFSKMSSLKKYFNIIK